MVDVLLIYPPYTYPKKSPPIGLGYIAAVMEKEGYSVKITDMSTLNMDYKGLEREVKQIKPKLVGISFMTNQYEEAVRASRIIKQINKYAPVMVGGPHVSAVPGEILAVESVDIVVIGEGERTVLEVADSLLKEKSKPLEAIKGLAYKKKGKIYVNPRRELIQNIDSIPFPAWHLLPVERYSVPAMGGNAAERVFAILSSRGCPNHCIFCDSHTIFGRKFRARSAQNIFDEITYLNKTFNARQFDFVDDTITINQRRIGELCNLILADGLKIKWMCNARVNTVNLETLKLMKKAGCVRIEFGVESGDFEVLEKLKKGITIEQIKTAHKLARKAGLSIASFVMVGNIGEDFNSIMKTKKFLQELDTDDVYVSIATPYPGTELYKMAQNNGWLRIYDWSKYVTAPTYLPDYQPVMVTDKMKRSEIVKSFFYLHSHFAGKKFRTRYGKAFFLNPRFYRKVVLNFRSIRDIKHKAKLAKEFVSGYFIGKICSSHETNILFISQYFPPDVTAAAFRVSETVSILEQDSFDVKVLTAVPHRAQVGDIRINDDSNVVRVPIWGIKGKTVKSYLLHYMSFMANSFLWGLMKTRSKIDYVIVTSPPLFVTFSGWLLARIKRAKFILDIRDIWPDSAVGTGHLNPSSWLYRVAKFLEHFIYTRADVITCVSEKMREYIALNVKRNIPILVLYNGLSIKFLGDNQINDSPGSPEDGFVISYVGNIGYAQNLDLIIDAAMELKDKDIKFILIGEGAAKDVLMTKVTAAGLKNVVFKHACSKKEAFEYMNRAHALLIILNKQCPAFNLTIPSKLFDYLWANKPILCDIEGEGKKVLGLLPGNLCFDSANPESLPKVVADLKDNYDFYKMKASKNRDFVLGNFTREKMVKKLEEYLV